MKKIILTVGALFLFLLNANACDPYFTFTRACAGDTVFFYGSYQPQYSYVWDFGDTASGAANLSFTQDTTFHIFSTPGTYYVSLAVGINFMWEYKTEEVIVSADCFYSLFGYSGCNLNMYFANESLGNITSHWDFGDPASGAYDTITTNHDTTHIFSAPGTYNVTLVVSDGIQSDTSFQTLTVDTGCSVPYILLPSIQLENNIICVNEPFNFIGSPGSMYDSCYWDFDDTASGALNHSINLFSTHSFSTPGIYVMKLILYKDLISDTLFTSIIVHNCSVWPGNTNGDGVVDMKDLFAIGLNYMDTGVIRPSATMNWIPQNCLDWTSKMDLLKVINMKFADCNGDGIINSLDINSIDQNYGMHVPGYTHNDRLQLSPGSQDDPVLIVNSSGTWTGSRNVSIPIDLNATTIPIVYGISARIYYDKNLIIPGSVNVSFNNSWIGNIGSDLIGLSKDNYSDGYVDFGLVRTNLINRSGTGTIAYLNFTLSQPSGIIYFNIDPDIWLIKNVNNLPLEEYVPVSTYGITFNFISASVDETDLNNENIFTYPNPVSNILNVKQKNNDQVHSIHILNSLGEEISIAPVKKGDVMEIGTSDFSRGFYFVEVLTDKSRYVARFVKE